MLRNGSPIGDRIHLDDALVQLERSVPDIVGLHCTLEDLERFDPQLAQIVELRFFGGLTNREIARELGISESSVVRGWRFARLWLYDALNGGEHCAE